MIEDRINKYYDSLSNTEKEIAKFIMKNRGECSQLGIVELANKCHCSKSSVLRMTKKLKFKGYSEFKYSLERNLNPHNSMDILTMQQQDIAATLKLFQQINSDEIIDIVYHADRLFFYGTGWAQRNVSIDLSRNLLSQGRLAYNIPAKTELALNVHTMTSKDALVVFALSGDVEPILPYLKDLALRDVPIISITAFGNNKLSQLTPYNLYYQARTLMPNPEVDHVSLITLHLLCDCLYRKYMIKIHENLK